MATQAPASRRPGSIGAPKLHKAIPSPAAASADEISLDEAAGRYRALLRALPDLMFVLSRDGTYVDFWADKEGELALPAGEILGKNLADAPFSAEALRDIRRKIKRTLRSGKPEVIEYRLETMDGSGYFVAHIARLDADHVLSVVRNITNRKLNEEHLRQVSQKLKLEKQALAEKNIALEQVLGHLERRAQEYQARVTEELERQIRPALTSLGKRLPQPLRAQVDHLYERVGAILARDIDVKGGRYTALSPRELEVCEMLRSGLTSKQVAAQLHISTATVHKHREQIRNKLGFQGKRVNLSAFLRLNPPDR